VYATRSHPIYRAIHIVVLGTRYILSIKVYAPEASLRNRKIFLNQISCLTRYYDYYNSPLLRITSVVHSCCSHIAIIFLATSFALYFRIVSYFSLCFIFFSWFSIIQNAIDVSRFGVFNYNILIVVV